MPVRNGAGPRPRRPFFFFSFALGAPEAYGPAAGEFRGLAAMKIDLSGKTAVIAAAAAAAWAKPWRDTLAGAGANIALVGRNKAKLDEVAARLSPPRAPPRRPSPPTMTDEGQVAAPAEGGRGPLGPAPDPDQQRRHQYPQGPGRLHAWRSSAACWIPASSARSWAAAPSCRA